MFQVFLSKISVALNFETRNSTTINNVSITINIGGILLMINATNIKQ